MTDSHIKLATIKDYLEELLQTLPPDLADHVRNLHKLTISLQANLELAERHQQQALNDMRLLGEILVSLRQCSFHVSDTAQKLTLLSALLKELDLGLDERCLPEG